MYDQAPGSVLQTVYLKHRLRRWARRGMKFIELGAGNGAISRVLLDFGFSGIGMDLNANAYENNSARNHDYIAAGKYEVRNDDFFLYRKVTVT